LFVQLHASAAFVTPTHSHADFQGKRGCQGSEVVLLQAVKARPEEHNSVSDGIRIGFVEQFLLKSAGNAKVKGSNRWDHCVSSAQ